MLLSVASGELVQGAEPWADARLPVRDHLQFWLDASRQPERRVAEDRPVLKNGDRFDFWYDASGFGRHLAQRNQLQQPQLAIYSEQAAVRFDGQDDCLEAAPLGLKFNDVTLFLVAAPRSNAGGFHAFLSLQAIGKNDYTSGLSLDMGAERSERFTALNAEGSGFSGAKNLLREGQALPFRTFHTFCITSSASGPEGKKGATSLFVDGQPAGERPRKKSSIAADGIVLGARVYSNSADPPFLQGFLDGEVAEVLLYDRLLNDDERRQVHEYLATKYSQLNQRVAAVDQASPLVPVKDPPAVQMFVPGFSVKQLPVDLTNINNIKYRHDGKLVALGYNGNIYLLFDTDGDHLEDKVELFWESTAKESEPVGMSLTPKGHPKGNGVFIPAKGKISLIIDSDGDDRGDKEIVVADGWKLYPYGIDAVGLAYNEQDGSVYFGIGTADYTNAYQVDKQGQAGYSPASEHGAVWRISPDFSKREKICTGTRFPVGMAFDRRGELFCTDQEGATWLANGNPFDELLHIQQGRHYGFPPRHPRHLQEVIDEPSTFDYRPQHQSTCGINFNESVNGGPTFGPDAWSGDALVCGYSRGKIYRTSLVSSPAGYVARNQILACLNMLCVDACVTPHGELAVSVHSGGPDWGTGPKGKGKLYKIFYTDREHPQPVAAWAAGPQEVRVAFDRPLDPAQLSHVVSRTGISYGTFVGAGDRFESLRPGYAVVQSQLSTPRFELPVLGAQLSSDLRTLIFSIAPQRRAASYAITLPGMGRPTPERTALGDLPQQPAIDLAYDLSGVEAEWTPNSPDEKSWTGWLPHLDLTVARQFTRQSSAQDELWHAVQHGGKLQLRTKLDLADMLRPAVQPGATIDYTWSAETVTLVLRSKGTIEVSAPGGEVAPTSGGETNQVEITWHPEKRKLLPLEVTLQATKEEPVLDVAYRTTEDERLRPLPLRRLLLPWAEWDLSADKPEAPAIPQELAGGSWARGRAIFLSPEAQCAKCHTAHGEGGQIGPSLENLPKRDYASVFRDVTNPNFAINPDFLTYAVSLKSGKQLTGAIRIDGDRLIVGDQQGNMTAVARADIEELVPTKTSTMPEEIAKKLNASQMKDLLTFLMTSPPRMPEYAPGPVPAARTKAEVEAVLAGAPQAAEPTRKINVLLVAGKKDHEAGEHDYPAWQKVWKELFALDAKTEVDTAWNWPSEEQFQKAEVMIFYYKGNWNAARSKQIDAYLARGGGLVYIHWAVDGRDDAPGFAQRIGLAWDGNRSLYRHGPLDLGFEDSSQHPIARNFHKVHFHDESYWQLIGDRSKIKVLATGKEDGQEQPLFWVMDPSPGGGRVFVSIPGHYSWTFDDPLFRILLLRGTAWAAGEPVDRYNALTTIGARIQN